jgi:hypothetical protein
VDAAWFMVSLALLASLAPFPHVSRILMFGVGILGKDANSAKRVNVRGVALFGLFLRQLPEPNIALLARPDSERSLSPLERAHRDLSTAGVLFHLLCWHGSFRKLLREELLGLRERGFLLWICWLFEDVTSRQGRSAAPEYVGAVRSGSYAKRETWRCPREVVLVGCKYPAFGVFSVLGDHKPRASCVDYRDGPTVPVEGVTACSLVEMAHDEDSGPFPLGESRQRSERLPYVLIFVRIRLL